LICFFKAEGVEVEKKGEEAKEQHSEKPQPRARSTPALVLYIVLGCSRRRRNSCARVFTVVPRNDIKIVIFFSFVLSSSRASQEREEKKPLAKSF
jgi:hypothetical protein